MVLIRSIVEVKYGHFADVARSYEELNDICRARGWRPATYRLQAGARSNVIAADLEYETLTEWEAEQAAAYADPEFMKVLRAASGTACRAPHGKRSG